jgi:hypothetical protein
VRCSCPIPGATAKALDDLFAICASRPLSLALLLEWRTGMQAISPSTVNVRLSAVRKMVGEARRTNMIRWEEAGLTYRGFCSRGIATDSSIIH